MSRAIRKTVFLILMPFWALPVTLVISFFFLAWIVQMTVMSDEAEWGN
jgi:hypothetical protein